MKAARFLLGCFRTGDANDPEVFIAGVIRILMAYPTEVIQQVIDPLTGLPGKQDWLPTFREVKAACDAIVVPMRAQQQREQAVRLQLTERQQIEDMSRDKPTHEELIERCAKVGIRIGGDRSRRIAGDAAEVKQRFNLTDEQWDAIPDAPELSRGVGR